ncbi:winged helix-turn-helix transcriptional regulator [Nocardioides acrostichi]|nr:helix-turn-helix domain-containing protein [Nocardioides acrostichi]
MSENGQERTSAIPGHLSDTRDDAARPGEHGGDGEAHPPAVVYRVDCPSRPILDQIADKWSMLALAVLAEEPRRFNQIKRQLEGVTQRVLTRTLRRLERNGMVTRTVLPTSPVGVQYELTPLGRSLQQPFAGLYAWTVSHADEIVDRQREFDARGQAIEG